VQLCVLRYLGWTLSDGKIIPEQALRYIASQIKVDSKSFAFYGDRDATKYEHIEEIRKEYGYSTFTRSEYHYLGKVLFNQAMANGSPIPLIQFALEDLRKRKIILPSIATIERAVWESRKRAEGKIFKLLNLSLSLEQIKLLDKLLLPMPGSHKTYLAWLKETPGTCSPESFLKIIEKLDFIRNMHLLVDIKNIHPNRLRQLSKIGSRYEPHSLRRFIDAKKYAILVAYLLELIQELTDQAFEIHDRQIMSLLSKGRKAHEEIQKQNGKSINEKVVHYADLGTALINARINGIDPFVAIEAIMPWDQLVTSVTEAKQLARPVDYDYLDLLERKFYTLRKYTPTLLKSLDFVSDQFSSFHTKVINTNARDAVHVIDGLLHHETDLDIQEHYTDTAGYTDQVFGLSHLLGFNFAPRLRDLTDSKLYFIEKPPNFNNLENILRGQINIKIIKENYNDVLRLAHSIREGTVSASLIMGKLGSYSRQNSLATALREMGRIEKTIFVLDYISSESLRRKIHRGLNKGEAMNALARAIFFGKHGELWWTDKSRQLYSERRLLQAA